MIKYLALVLLLGSVTPAICQVAYPYKDIKLEKSTDFKETEPLALSAANFILGTPFLESDADRAGALLFISNWMTGTKHHSFHMNGLIANLVEDKNLLSIFVAATVKFCLENRVESVNPLKTEQNARRITLAYCDDPKNNFKLKKKFRKLLENN